MCWTLHRLGFGSVVGVLSPCDGHASGSQPIALSIYSIMAAKEASNRLLPASTCSGWRAYGELRIPCAKKFNNP